MLVPFHITAISLPDAWFQACYNIMRRGRPFKIDKGSYAGQSRMEFDYITIHITQPWRRCADGFPLIPEIPEGMGLPAPVTKEYLADYAPYIMTDKKEPGEDYTYGERLNGYFYIMTDQPLKFYYNIQLETEPVVTPAACVYRLNQVQEIISTYRNKGHRNNQMVLQIAQPSDLQLDDSPCLRQIDTRIQDGRLHFFPYFRSWDLWNGLPANLAGISMLQEYMAEEIGVEQGEMICASKGLHLYDYAWELANTRTRYEMEATQ